MAPFFLSIFFLGLSSLAMAATFTPVYESNELEFDWPSEEIKTKALQENTFNPWPISSAVYGSRLFLSLSNNEKVPVTLVSIPTNSVSTTHPKLAPFPSWDMNSVGLRDCNKIQFAKGLEVDANGRLWVLDEGTDSCDAKLWIFNLEKNDTLEHVHQFSFPYLLHDLVLDETPDGYFAYISRFYREQIVVFSLKTNQSWVVETPDMQWTAIALAPKKGPARQVYLGKQYDYELHTISAALLRNGTETATPKSIGTWTAEPYRMLMDNLGTIYTTFESKNYTSSLNTSQPFQEKPFHGFADLDFTWPFTVALDQNGTLWMTVYDKNIKPKYRLLKAPVGVKSYIFEATPVCSETCNLEHGVCLEVDDCRCKVGWKGDNCDVCQPYPGCVNGTCDQPWECNCLPGFRGKLCNLKNE
ncbi:protein yellow-like [Cloeon dipterum]|uniref:protein yellow-like n=1 Tax=Cloeon dipterum TaxID=197152 RepID=UPI00321FA43A